MPLQNRVTPFGIIEAVAARGTMMGNRGGKFHRDDRTLGRRRWATHHWICCELYYKNAHHEAMGRGYTSLFFLDEVTALAAGHRPCFFCRRREARHFMTLAGIDTNNFDRALHAQRLERRFPDIADAHKLPDGVMVTDGTRAFAIRNNGFLRWSHEGYSTAHATGPFKLLTPPLIASILEEGFQPRWHESAL